MKSGLILTFTLMSLLIGGPALAAEQLTGTLAVLGPSPAHTQVALVVGEARTILTGELASNHLPRLTALTVQVKGERAGDSFVVSSYEIIDVGGGLKPKLGYVRCPGGGECAIEPLSAPVIGTIEPAGTGAPMEVNSKALQKRLTKMADGLIWYVPHKTPDGKNKLRRFGLIYMAKEAHKHLKHGDPIAR